MYLPPNVTSSIQPTNQGVIEKLKRIYRKQVLRWLLLDDGTENSVFVLLKYCCYMLAYVWDSLAEDNLGYVWKELWTLPEKQEVEEERVNSEKNDLNEFVKLFGNIPWFTDCDKDDALDCSNYYFNDLEYQILGDNEIISSIKTQDDHDNDSSSD